MVMDRAELKEFMHLWGKYSSFSAGLVTSPRAGDAVPVNFPTLAAVAALLMKIQYVLTELGLQGGSSIGLTCPSAPE